MDILINLYLISDHSVREILAKNLDMCKQAIPLVFPMSSQTLAILWPLYNIDKCFTSDSGEIRKEFVKLDLDRTHNQMHEPKRQERKELCACGSGKKYKKCCLELDQNNSVSSLISEK